MARAGLGEGVAGASRLGAESVEMGTAGPWGRALRTRGTGNVSGIISMVTPPSPPHLPAPIAPLPQCGVETGNSATPMHIIHLTITGTICTRHPGPGTYNGLI